MDDVLICFSYKMFDRYSQSAFLNTYYVPSRVWKGFVSCPTASLLVPPAFHLLVTKPFPLQMYLTHCSSGAAFLKCQLMVSLAFLEHLCNSHHPQAEITMIAIAILPSTLSVPGIVPGVLSGLAQ